MTTEIRDPILKIIAEHAGKDAADIRLDATLEDLDVASLDAIEILFDIEEHFDIDMPERDPNFDTGTVQGLIDIVASIVAEKNDTGDAVKD